MSANLKAARRFLEEPERRHEPTLATIREHHFVTGIRDGQVPLEGLRRFAVEGWGEALCPVTTECSRAAR